MEHVHQESYTIRANEVGANGVARPDSMAGLLQEIAGNHANILNFDIKDLQGENSTWVLHQLHMCMYKYPSWRDTITIQTWPSSGDGLRAYRDFRILDASETELGVALSYWLIMDLSSRKPIRIPKAVLDLGLETDNHVLPVSSEKMNWEIGDGHGDSFKIRRTDVDLNRHANNVAFIRWILESVDEPTYLNKTCAELNIQFRSEARLNDEVEVISSNQGSDTKYKHLIKHGDRPLGIGLTRWER